MSAPRSEASAARVDCYKEFRFKVKWDGRYVAGFSKMSTLKPSTGAVTHQGTGTTRSYPGVPGQPNYDPITLEHGFTYDVDFTQWANKVWDYPPSRQLHSNVSLHDFREDIAIELFNEAGEKVLAYNVFRCWVSEFQTLPELDAAGNATAIRTLTLQNEGWERAESIPAPSA